MVLLVLFLGSCRRSRVSFVSRRAPLSAVPDIQRVPFGLDVFLLIDQSGSMFGPKGTDPKGLRISATQYFARNIAFKVAQKSPHRVGIINFGTTAPKKLMIPLTRANEDSIELVMSELKVVNLHYTSFISALKIAYQEFTAKGSFISPGRKPVVIIFTDGRPDDPRHLALNQYFKEIEGYIDRKLKPNGCELFIVGIDKTGKSWLKDKPRWEVILPGHVYEIKDMSQLREKFNEIIRQIFYIPEVQPDTVTQKGLEFDVPPYLEDIEFHIFPEKEVVLAIYRSNGEKVDTADADVRIRRYPHYEMVSITDPSPGKWRYEIEKGKGKVEVYRNPIPIKMELLRPLSIHPLKKQMDIEASFLRPDGREVKEYPQFPLRFTGRVIFPREIIESRLKYVYQAMVGRKSQKVVLGESLFEAAMKFTSNDPEGVAVREDIRGKIDKLQTEKQQDLSDFVEELKEKFRAINIKGEISPEEDLKRLMKLILWEEIDYWEGQNA